MYERRRGGARPVGERGQQGRPPAALTPREGAVSWPLRGQGGSRVGLQAEMGSLWQVIKAVAGQGSGGGRGSSSRRKRLPSDIPKFPHLAG